MSHHMCPEKRLEIVIGFFDNGVPLIQYASTCFVSIPSLRKWIKDFMNSGFKGLCSDDEWNEREKMINEGYVDLSNFHCCRDYPFSKEAIDFFNNPQGYMTRIKMSR